MDDASLSGEVKRQDRRQTILDAAESLFIEHGFEGTSLAAIVRRSGGSLATVYELFRNKQGLLRAVIEENRMGNLCDVEDLARKEGSAAEALRHLARCVHDFFTQPRSIAMMRIMIQESLRDPQFARDFHRDLHGVKVRELADIFQAWTDEGKAVFDDPCAAAELYFAIVKCDAPINAMIGSEQACGMDPALIDWRLAPFISHFKIK